MGSGKPHLADGARKERLRRREYARPADRARTPYAELHAASAFSFLDGASLPEDLVARAVELALPAVALVDRNGVYGAPRFYKAAREAGLKAIVGAEVVIDSAGGRDSPPSACHPERSEGSGRRKAASAPLPGPSPRSGRQTAAARDLPLWERLPRLTLLVESREGYRNLCKLLTAAARGRPKGEARADWAMVEAHAAGLHCLTGGDEGTVARALLAGGDGRRELLRLAAIFPQRLHVELQRHRRREEEARNCALIELAGALRLPLVATNGARYAHADDKRLHDVMTCIRRHTHLDAAGALLEAHRERHLKGAAEMAALFPDLPRALQASAELAARLDFTLADLGYRFPDYPLPPGETADSYLRQVTWNGARARFRPLTARAQAQLEKELALIAKLELAGYFLIVWDIVQFCRREGILVQGRGSAANSAVCYALSITAVDPVKMELLFERFLSEERGEWPDIDLDLPSGDPREKVIQYVYQRYGGEGSSARVQGGTLDRRAHPPARVPPWTRAELPGEVEASDGESVEESSAQVRDGARAGGYARRSSVPSRTCAELSGDVGFGGGAAMTANVITYRDRSAAREAGKALGFSAEQIDTLAKQLGSFSYDLVRGDPKSLAAEIAAAGFDPEAPRLRLFGEMWQRLQNLPRHLGQHSGGMVIAAGRLDEVVPLEPAAMPGRVVVQWDKDDCADLGIIKVDLLGLGMLQAIEEMIPTIRARERISVDLAHLPPDDPEVYRVLRAADTVGLFQVESRAQMASLPRNAPERFYDLVIQVAIIRPGPIMGGMIHPFFERRLGRMPVEYPHPSLEPILERTLGVPIFQEQLLRIAMVAAGFTGGEAEELRRAMGFKRSLERMRSIEEKLRRGMSERGIVGAAQEQIVQSITSFALYGFPESHAASFALIAYASAWLKVHHPTAFYVALLNAWPMGFYHPATLVKDAQRHGVEVRPIDVSHSGWRCAWEERRAANPQEARGAVRLGLRYVRGLREQIGRRIESERRRGRFAGVEDLERRCALHRDELARLAEVGALGSLGSLRLSRRAALWQAALAARPAGPLYAGERPAAVDSPLPEMTPFEETLADYEGTSVTVGPHPMEYFRAQLDRRGVVPAAALAALPSGRRVRTAGSVIVRQRPGTAKGMLFLTLEDETGMSQAIVTPDLLRENRRTIVGAPGLVVEGELQQRDGSVSVRAEKFWPLGALLETPSHDFR
jgi:error-prone DNA polymerase